MQTVLVTGGCGYIGSHVTRKLSERGFKVVVLDNLSTGFADALLHGETLVEGDLADDAILDRVFTEYQFSAVFHFAASIVVPESVAAPISYYENNGVNTLRLVKKCVTAGVKNFVLSSTAAVYGDQEHDSVTEDMPTVPSSPYGRSKLLDEWVLEDVSVAHDFNYVALRYFNVAGADFELRMGQRFPNATHLIKVLSELAVGKRKEVTVFGTDYPTADGTGVRDYIHIEDLADAHLCAFDYLESKNKSLVVNCGYGHGSSVREVISSAIRVMGADLSIVDGPRRPGDVSKVVANNSKILQHFDWVPKHDDLDKIVESAYQWEKKQP